MASSLEHRSPARKWTGVHRILYNSRISDLREAAVVAKGRKVKRRPRLGGAGLGECEAAGGGEGLDKIFKGRLRMARTRRRCAWR